MGQSVSCDIADRALRSRLNVAEASARAIWISEDGIEMNALLREGGKDKSCLSRDIPPSSRFK
jgi:hypothetical protein